jgi:pimeloyl-ACP methyl ester carboxylesterase
MMLKTPSPFSQALWLSRIGTILALNNIHAFQLQPSGHSIKRRPVIYDCQKIGEIEKAVPSATPFVSPGALSRHGFSQSELARINHKATLFRTMNQLQVQSVPTSKAICPDGTVGITYSYWPPHSEDINTYSSDTTQAPLVVLLHGFDLSCLEFRRLGPLLASGGYHVVAPDLLGWGFSQVENISDFSAKTKTETLASFLSQFATKIYNTNTTTVDMCLLGASLGAATSVDLFPYINGQHIGSALQDIKINIKCAVWISAQVFLDATALKFIPGWYARFLIKLLKIPFLRRIVNSMSVHDKDWYYDTAGGEGGDVLSLWTLQSKRPGWEEAHFSFMKSGGFAPTSHLKEVQNLPSLIIGGKNDGILGNFFTNKLSHFLRNSKLIWIDDCGHFPHEEKPEEAAEVIGQFLNVWLKPQGDPSR